ncbi:MAG TPA: choice-of-anchor L domain-containing protein [Symbiobacteriaceae bacterium]|nr:choice-of-anchor L domain-containing protein [Symbiobacteriaceae bacterium]
MAASEGLVVTDISAGSPESLVGTLLGANPMPVSNIRYTGAPLAAGQFTGGSGIIGFESGIILSSGYVRNVMGPNQTDDITGKTNQPGDDDLGPGTFDAAVLEFDFVPSSGSISFQYVFSSDEYNEWANSDFNDVFGFYVNGMNYALVPGTEVPVSINTINGGNPVGVDPQNPEYFVNNEMPYEWLNTEMDGLTVVLKLQAPVWPNEVNHLKLAIADVGDDQWDSNVFLKEGSFTDVAGGPPETMAAASPAPNAAGWNRTDVMVLLQASPASGDSVREIHYRVGDGTEKVVDGDTAMLVVSTEGETAITYFAVSSSGVTEEPKTLTLKLDKEKPAIEGDAYREPNEYGWYKGEVPVAFSCTDAISGIVDCLGYATLHEGANQSVTGTAIDMAGNVSMAVVSGINVDNTPPVTSVTAQADGLNRNVAVTLLATDTLSGVKTSFYQIDGGAVQSGTSFRLTENGAHTITYWSEDKAGNMETARKVTLEVDKTAPAITPGQSPAPNAEGWNNTDVAVAFTCTDANGIASCTGETTLTAEGQGQEVTGTATDLAGNTATAKVTVNIDKTAPDITAAVDRQANEAGWYNAPVTVTFTCTDSLSGIATCPEPEKLDTDGAGLGTFGTAMDRAGNSSSTMITGIKIDMLAPVTTATATMDETGGAVTVTLTATDSLSGVRATYYTVNGGAPQTGESITFTTGGLHTVRYWSVDLAGNAEPAGTITVTLDQTPPTITGQADRPANAEGWYNAPVTVTFTCTDGGSGIADCTGPVTLSEEGRGQSAGGTATDKAGNTASATVSGINIDLTAPETTATAPEGWVKGPVTITFAAMDNLSGVKATYYKTDGGATQTGAAATLTAGGSHTVSYWSVDKAGNAEAPKTVTVQIDGAPPTISHTQSPAPNSYGWNNTDVAVDFICHDDSGIASCTGDTTVTTDGRNQVVTGTATDIAGNTATDSASVNIDKTAPVVTFDGNQGTYTLDQRVSITCTASDSLSGVASTDCRPIAAPAYTFAFVDDNSYTATATAIDKAGNAATQSVTFSINLTADGTCGMISQLVPHHGVANSLCVKIRNSQAAERRGQSTTELNELDAFIQEVEAQRDKAKITNTNANILIRMANYLKTAPPLPEDNAKPGADPSQGKKD